MKKHISILLVFCFIFSISCNIALGLENNNEGIYINTPKIPAKVHKIVNNDFNNLLLSIKLQPESFGFDSKEINRLYLGKGFKSFINNNNMMEESDVYYFPVLHQNNVRGFVKVFENTNGEYGISLSKEFADEFGKLKGKNSKDDPFILVYSGGNLVATNRHEKIILDKISDKEDNSIHKLSINSINNIPKKSENQIINCLIKDNLVLSSISIKSSGSQKYLDVPIVENRNDSGQPRPWCWAACVASITNYLKDKNYSAEDIYDSYKNYGSYDPEVKYYTLSHGEIEDVFEDIGFSRTKLDMNNSLNKSEIINEIDNNRPINSFLAGSNTAHSNVIRGYCDLLDTFYVAVMEPNEDYYVSYKTYYNPKYDEVYYNAEISGKFMYWKHTIYNIK